ncbi:hypothetical protein RJ639_041725 [Escallonia herrerae]|uniref:Serine/threonine-protein phosphatase 6 regulatory subunit 2 n=1 Tax=Escallonia herrerae TaxID=1293975 RepID=A0AA88WIU9_9ASTE|nr:hypothetical protein RJ639_041725 [Escallonia herrerae]
MFWRMAGLSTASPVETLLDRENFTLEELLDEDEIIQECKALNSRLINFLRERTQIEQLIRYIVEEAPEDTDKRQTFKFPFIACEIFTCEVDIILKALVEDEELMNLLFSFLEPEHSHSTLLAGYFSKVVICLLLRKTAPLMNYIRAHQDIIRKLVDYIGITSVMEVLIRLIGADEHLYTNYTESMQWLEDTDVLEMIVDKFSSSDCPEVHANAAETLCAITRYAPPGLAAKISSPSFIGRLFRHALEDSRPESVLVHSLSVCISLLDPKRLTLGSYYMYNRQTNHGSLLTSNPVTVEGMLESLGERVWGWSANFGRPEGKRGSGKGEREGGREAARRRKAEGWPRACRGEEREGDGGRPRPREQGEGGPRPTLKEEQAELGVCHGEKKGWRGGGGGVPRVGEWNGGEAEGEGGGGGREAKADQGPSAEADQWGRKEGGGARPGGKEGGGGKKGGESGGKVAGEKVTLAGELCGRRPRPKGGGANRGCSGA